ncbi:MAG: branched-chain amino acid ABC transporter permease [Burkholderiales bacterium]|jgi:branched-chain amino acid transport system permease protein|nr:MAG: branched-chain amino acid ABC transporter permease [Burkholderiales bacterium]
MLEILSPRLVGELLLNGLLFGAMYGVAAIGLSLIFGTMRIIFLAQGAMIVLAGYCAYWAFALLGVDPYVTMIALLPVSLVVGAAIYQLLFRRAAAIEDKNTSLLIAVGLMFMLESLMSVAWTPDPRSITTTYTATSFDVGGMPVSITRSIAFVVALVATALVTLFLKRTLIGKAVRAVSENMTSSMLVGISPHRVNMVAFAVGIALAGVAGCTLASTYAIDPYFGFLFSLKALIALALGGLGNVGGALAGGLLLGVIESGSSFFIPGWGDAIGYLVFLLVLMFRPEGLFVRSVKKA